MERAEPFVDVDGAGRIVSWNDAAARVTGRTAAEVAVAALRSGGTARITVADRGIGIPADQRRQVLSSFHRAHTGQGYAGTGLGLAIVQRVVDRHGGTIGIEENPGGGTVVTISLPQPD
nr:hypothetical protein GCM10020063_057090 [Dactylosporangium thailandense]